MLVEVKLSELTIHPPVNIRFGFSGLGEKHAQSIMRDIIKDGWPSQRRPAQSVCSIRLVGAMAVTYPTAYSPVTYIGEGNAFHRLYQHTVEDD